jgi:hypothetical protein
MLMLTEGSVLAGWPCKGVGGEDWRCSWRRFMQACSELLDPVV